MSINNNELFEPANAIRDSYDVFMKSQGYPAIIKALKDYFLGKDKDKDFEVITDNRINPKKTDQFFIKVRELSNSGVQYYIGVNVELGNVNRGYDIYYFCAIEKDKNRKGDCRHGFDDLSEYLINNLNSDGRWNYNAKESEDNHLVKLFKSDNIVPLKFLFLEKKDINSEVEKFAEEINTCIKRSKLSKYKLS